jgi:hypothetical protein
MSDSTTAVWSEALNVCALADAERHLGHAVRVPQGWTAYDATQLNTAADGFKELGAFRTIAEAKIAIENSLGICGRPARRELMCGLLSSPEALRNKVQHNVFKMPVYKVDDQTRYRD